MSNGTGDCRSLYLVSTNGRDRGDGGRLRPAVAGEWGAGPSVPIQKFLSALSVDLQGAAAEAVD